MSYKTQITAFTHVEIGIYEMLHYQIQWVYATRKQFPNSPSLCATGAN